MQTVYNSNNWFVPGATLEYIDGVLGGLWVRGDFLELGRKCVAHNDSHNSDTLPVLKTSRTTYSN